MSAASASLADRVVVIAGGAGLLGKTFCAAAARLGAIVVVADANEAAANQVVADLKAQNLRARPAALDITDAGQLNDLIAALDREYGRIDAVVNTAYPRSAAYGRRLEQVEYADFTRHVSMHLGGCFLVAQRFAAYFKTHGGGNIVNLASVYGIMPPRFEIYEKTEMTMPVEYAAIKAGVIHLTRYFAQYFKKDGIRCNAIAPGGVADSQPRAFVEAYGRHTATGDMLAPNDVAGTLLFLLSDASRHITGQCLVVDDGFSL